MNVTDRKPALSYAAAKRCEEAQEPKCVCRCGGALHGAKGKRVTGSVYDVIALPEDDPHYPGGEVRSRREATVRFVRQFIWWWTNLPYSSRAYTSRITKTLADYPSGGESDQAENAKSPERKDNPPSAL